MMRVFVDLHHFDLYHFFQRVFETRFGWEVYRPIGREWLDYGIWDISKEPLAVTGYLSEISGAAETELSKYETFAEHPEWARFGLELLRVGDIEQVSAGIYSILDKSKGMYQRGISFQKFIDTDFDVIISSVPQHFVSFEQLRRMFQPRAKHIFHMGPGNVEWEVPLGAKNLILHTPPKVIPPGLNIVYCHQEFDTAIFKPSDDIELQQVLRSYVHFPESEELATKVIASLDGGWNCEFVGKTLGNVSNMIVTSTDLAKSIQEAAFIWHIKPGGESCGHILHNAFACGKPVVTSIQDYQGKLGGKLLEDMVTCISVDNRTPDEIATILQNLWGAPTYGNMCQSAYNRFCAVVDFDGQADRIHNFVENLI